MAFDLRDHTPARVALGRAGDSLPTQELLRFELDHARARDAVYAPLDPASLPFPHILLRSCAGSREEFLRNPEAGRSLASTIEGGSCELAVVVADGLSATAVHCHAAPLLAELDFRVPVYVVLQGRVAIGDEIGERLGAKLVLVLIGERPGLSSPDSLGAYLTYNPRVGRTDAERNCVSNIRPQGLSYKLAAHKLRFLMSEALIRRLTGIDLKEDAPLLLTES